MSESFKKPSKAPPPISPLRGGSYVAPKKTKARTPDWEEWKYTPRVRLWYACALSMNINPHSLEFDRVAGQFEPDTDDEEVKEEFSKRLRILSANAHGPSFSARGTGEVRLDEFAAWASGVENWRDSLPPELVALAKKSEKPKPRHQSESYGWKTPAKEIASDLRMKNPTWNIEKIAEKTNAVMVQRNGKGDPGMTGRGGKVPSAGTIKRHALTGI